MAYCTAANLVAALDQRTVGELCSDTGTPQPVPNAVVDELIGQAQGEIDMYIRVGNRYTADNIAALEAAENPTLVRLAVDLTIELLFLRRGRAIPEGIMGRIERTRAALKAISEGELIFGSVSGARAAGLPTVQAVPTNTTAYYGGSYASQFYPPIPWDGGTVKRLTVEMVVRAVQSAPVRAGIGSVIQSCAQRHIAESAGRKGPLKPIKPLFGNWTGKGGVERTKAGRRNGGQPLRDTGRLMRSLRVKVTTDGSGNMKATVAGEPYGAAHEKGFSTTGPNFIPLTRKGAVAYSRGTALIPGKLIPGKDYIMAWNGVKVPARPFMQPTKEDMRTIGLSVYEGLKAALGGR